MLKYPAMDADTAAEFRKLPATIAREISKLPHRFKMATNPMYRVHQMARGLVDIEIGKGLGLAQSDLIFVLKPDISATPEQLAPIINELVSLPVDYVEVHLHSVPDHLPFRIGLPVAPKDIRRFIKESLDEIRTREPAVPAAPAA